MHGGDRETGGSRRERLKETIEKLRSSRLSEDTSSEEQSPTNNTDTCVSLNPLAEASSSQVSVNESGNKLNEESLSLSESDSSSIDDFAEEAVLWEGSSNPRKRYGPAIVNKQHGREGREIYVDTNYVKLNRKESRGIFKYQVDFTPNINSMRLQLEIIRSANVVELIGEVFEFKGNNLFLPVKLPEDQVDIAAKVPSDSSEITVSIKFIKEPPSCELITFFYTIFRRIMGKFGLVKINWNYYDPSKCIEIPEHRLELWPGMATAVLDFEGGLMLRCDISHRVFGMKTVRDMLLDILHHPESRSQFQELARKELANYIVLTRYNNKAYPIDDIKFDSNPMHEFTLSDGSIMTYMEYYKTHWNIEIKDPKQPMLLTRSKHGQLGSHFILLVPELSYMTGQTDDILNNRQVMRDIAANSHLRPVVYYEMLQEFIQKVKSNESTKKILEDWGLELDDQPFHTKARRIQPEQLFFGNNKVVEVSAEKEWLNDAHNSKLLQPIPIQDWVIVFNHSDSVKVEEFIQTLQQVSHGMGFSMANPRKYEIMEDLTDSYSETIRNNTNGAQLVVIIIPGSSQRDDLYSTMKKLCFSELAVPLQVVRADTINRRELSAVCQYIALQITCKVGGQLWGIKIPFENCMIVGIDEYRGASLNHNSVIGFVASMNPNLSRWYTRVYYQNNLNEIAKNLRTAMISCLKKYFETTKTLPERIFVFRDGVSYGQMTFVRDFEIPEMEDGIAQMSRDHNVVKPLLSVVVIPRRVNFKMLMRDRQTNDLHNPPIGSIIDHSVTHKCFYDFYIISQHVHQGTVTPTHYITLYDKNEMSPDQMQRLTYKLTHLYFNSRSIINVPAPCMYAYKAAAMVGQHVKKEPCDALCDKLFYL